MRIVALLSLVAALAAVPAAHASDRIALNASHVRLAVSKDGKRALVTFVAQGRTRHVLVWGAVNALPPSDTVPQVRFTIDWTGGWETFGHTIWRSFGDACRRSEEHTSELQSQSNIVCRLLLEKK